MARRQERAGSRRNSREGGSRRPRRASSGGSDQAVGRLSVARSGAAFLVRESGGDDLRMRTGELGGACHGDRVAVRIERRPRGRPEGRVVRVLERAQTAFVGTLRLSGRGLRVVPDDSRGPGGIRVPVRDAGSGRDGQKVVVEVVDWGSSRTGPVGRVVEVLGTPGDPGLDVLMIVKASGLPTEFPEDVRAEAAALPAAVPAPELRRRLDLRELCVVTIDPATARDFDDALSLAPAEDGNLELGVHIADVSHYVRFDSALDREARRRGTSVYLVDRVLPMLPEALSNELCSLKPDVDRLAVTVLMRMTPRGKLLSARIEDSAIRSDRRLSYEEVQAHFDGDPALRRVHPPVSSLLDGLRRLAANLHARRRRRGALDLDLPETRVELDPEGFPVEIHKVVRLESHRLVEEFMLLANETVAQQLERAGAPALHRVHEKPGAAKLEELRSLAARLGHVLRVDAKGGVAAKELQALLGQVEGRPEEALVGMLVLRSLARARYDVEPLGHYALALRHYAHFTSPIRRYPDLVVHRALRVLSGRQPPSYRNPKRMARWLSETAAHTSDRERVAEAAERDSIELKKLQFMERLLGEVLPGVVSGVEAFGIFVELEGFHVSGLVRVSELSDDFYDYREGELALVGRRSGRRFALGDRLVVRVAAVRRELRQIDFALEESRPPPARGRKPARKKRRH